MIALISELGTTWLMSYRSVADTGAMLCYRNLGTVIADRLLFWPVFFLLLSAVWLLLSRNRRTA
jgi:hypothetical protein